MTVHIAFDSKEMTVYAADERSWMDSGVVVATPDSMPRFTRNLQKHTSGQALIVMELTDRLGVGLPDLDWRCTEPEDIIIVLRNLDPCFLPKILQACFGEDWNNVLKGLLVRFYGQAKQAMSILAYAP